MHFELWHYCIKATIFPDLKSLGSLRPWDLVLLGKQAYQMGLGERSIEWFKAAVREGQGMELTDEESQIIPMLKETILMVGTSFNKKYYQLKGAIPTKMVKIWHFLVIFDPLIGSDLQKKLWPWHC